MFYSPDKQAYEERFRDLRREAEQGRLVDAARARRPRPRRNYAPALASVGRWLAGMGLMLRQ